MKTVILDDKGRALDPDDPSARLFETCTLWSPKPTPAQIEHWLKNGADVDPYNPLWGYTALAMAAHNDSAAAIEVLLRHGADRNARDGKGLIPFQVAAKHVRPAAMELFLRNGADPNIRDAEGKTPLVLVLTNSAVNEERLAAVQLLIQCNCWVDTPDNSGATALDYIARMKQAAWGPEWKDMCGKIETLLNEAVQSQPTDLVRQVEGGTRETVSVRRIRFKSPGMQGRG